MRIVLINWQDRENPKAGGAEIHLHEIFGKLVSRGHDVRAVVGGWPGASARVVLDGIEVLRVGHRHTFPFHVRRAVRSELKRRGADVVIEDINKVPLYSPLWAGPPVVALVPHLFGDTAFQEVSAPLAAVVWMSERPLPYVYRNSPFQAISEGTAEDLVRRGIQRERIEVIPPGIEHEVYNRPSGAPREEAPTAVYVGRLKRYKAIDIVLRAFARLVQEVPDARFDIVGQGDDRDRLESITESLGLQERVCFHGRIDTAEKVRRLRSAWVAVYPSPKEGWGIANIEAAACGTPVVASDSPGLRESVSRDRSGVLVPHDDIEAWHGALRRLLEDRSVADSMTAGCLAHARAFSWARAAEETEDHLERVLRTGRSRPA